MYRILGLQRQLPPMEEQALSQMLEGFHKFVRYLHSSAAPPSPPDQSEPDEEPS